MSQSKRNDSAPAGIPLLQEVGYTISYEYVVVTTEDLREMKAKLDAAPDKAKYAIFRALLFYGNLRRWQKQGFHWLYTSGPGTQHCTCGLVLNENGTSDQEIAVVISKNVQNKLDGLELEQIQMVRGHVGLPSLKGDTVALIVEYIYREELDYYLWTAICQQCGEYVVGVRDTEADSFVKSHNSICGPVIFEKKGR